MKITVTNHAIQTKGGTRMPGELFEIEDKDAEWLIARGYAKKTACDTEAKPEAKPEAKLTPSGGAK